MHSINADLNRLKEARDFAERAAAEFGFDSDGRYQVKLALSEAITNAIQHGSSSSNDTVRVVVAEEAGALVFEVFDSGRFVPRVERRGRHAREWSRARVHAFDDGRGRRARHAGRHPAPPRQAAH